MFAFALKHIGKTASLHFKIGVFLCAYFHGRVSAHDNALARLPVMFNRMLHSYKQAQLFFFFFCFLCSLVDEPR